MYVRYPRRLAPPATPRPALATVTAWCRTWVEGPFRRVCWVIPSALRLATAQLDTGGQIALCCRRRFVLDSGRNKHYYCIKWCTCLRRCKILLQPWYLDLILYKWFLIEIDVRQDDKIDVQRSAVGLPEAVALTGSVAVLDLFSVHGSLDTACLLIWRLLCSSSI